MSGWKDWAIGEVVTETDFQSFVQDQVVQIYDDATDRDNTLGTAVAEGMVAYLKDTNAAEVYNGTAWVAIGAGDITAVVAGTALTGGGTAGDVTLDVDLTAVSIPVSQITDLTATAAELNVLDGITATTTELNYTDGVTSAIQSQLDGKVDEVNGAVTTAATGSNVVRNITLSTSAPSGGSDGDVWLVYTA